MSYENETCDACKHSCGDDPMYCDNDARDASNPEVARDYRCPLFAPSLECRKVRALEKLADRVDFLIDHGLATHD
jgi:hypothetical protein